MKETFYSIAANVSFTIALISDLHNRKGTKALRSISQQKPDIIAITGDMVMGFRSSFKGLSRDYLLIEQQENVIPFLKSCSEIAPTFFSLGIHEWFLSEEDIAVIESTGTIVLDNRWIADSINGYKILIGGLTSVFLDNYRVFKKGYNERYPIPPEKEKPKIKHPSSKWIDEFEKCVDYKILLSHHPEYWSLGKLLLSEKKIDLILFGHAHGGQIRLWGSGLYAPGQGMFPPYTKGVWVGKYGRLVVSAGLSNTSTLVPRIFNPTEIVYVNLSNA